MSFVASLYLTSYLGLFLVSMVTKITITMIIIIILYCSYREFVLRLPKVHNISFKMFNTVIYTIANHTIHETLIKTYIKTYVADIRVPPCFLYFNVI